MSVAAPMTLNAFPAKLKPPAPSCVNEPSKLNPCPTVWYVLVLTKEQGKGKWALPKNLRRLLTTIWQRKAVWKTLFQNKSSGTINPVHLPRKLLNKTKKVSIKTRCLSQNLPTIFILQLMKSIPFKLNPFQPCVTAIYLPNGIAKEQGHGTKSLV